MLNTLKHPFKKILLCSLSGLVFIACNKDVEVVPTVPPPVTPPVIVPQPPVVVPNTRPDVAFYGLTDNNMIVRYNARTAENAELSFAVAGLPAGESLLSIDFRPATGQLYALGSTSRLYVINLASGVATPLGTAPFTPALSGTIANIDFNPTVDRIRLVSNTGQNLRLVPETGAVAAVDGNINGGTNPSISSIAYSNNFAGAATTELFVIDVTSRKLFKQVPPNNGTLVEVATINVNFTGKGGFDIVDTFALVTFTVDGVNKLYSINTITAAATFIVNLAGAIRDIAIPTAPVAYAISENDMFQIFNPTNNVAVINKAITGVMTGDVLRGIDFRPVNGQLYGIGIAAAGTARLYTFNLSTGAATMLGTGFAVSPNTSAVGFDFNPVVDRIRFVSSTGQNLRLNPNDGTLAATDANLNPGTPAISGAAYTNNFAGTTSTVLFVVDMSKLYRQDPPNSGVLVEIGNLNVSIESQNGFDIGGSSNNAYGLFTAGGMTKVYFVNTTTGSATPTKDFPNKVKGLAVGLGF